MNFMKLSNRISLSSNNPLSGFDSFNAGLSWVFRFEKGIQLLQGRSFRFHKEEIHKSQLKSVPENEEHIEPVSDLEDALVQSCWDRKTGMENPR